MSEITGIDTKTFIGVQDDFTRERRERCLREMVECINRKIKYVAHYDSKRTVSVPVQRDLLVPAGPNGREDIATKRDLLGEVMDMYSGLGWAVRVYGNDRDNNGDVVPDSPTAAIVLSAE